MLGLERVDHLDGEYVCARIDEILDSISAEAAGKEARLCLSMRLGAKPTGTVTLRRGIFIQPQLSPANGLAWKW
jgi:hypothetical protein